MPGGRRITRYLRSPLRGPSARRSRAARKMLPDLDGPKLAEFLVGGVLKADLRP
ncbi:MAG: hypothetical protein ABSA03_00425 [Streptosporangiaceae bacterium]